MRLLDGVLSTVLSACYVKLEPNRFILNVFWEISSRKFYLQLDVFDAVLPFSLLNGNIFISIVIHT